MILGLQRLSRADKAFVVAKRDGLGLEIGPSHNLIAPKSKGFNVHVLDHATAGELKKKYEGHGVRLENIEEVDFVWKGQPLTEVVGRSNCYDWIIASHVVEHVPDLIGFLKECESLLKPDGILSLIIPDKRYCFDFFSARSTTGQVLDAWQQKRTRPSPGQVFDYVANSSTRRGKISWKRDWRGGATGLLHTFDQAQALWRQSQSTEEYIDVHCWRFTPKSFRLMLSDLQRLSLLGLEIKTEFGTSGTEFHVSLGKGRGDAHTDRFAALSDIHGERH